MAGLVGCTGGVTGDPSLPESFRHGRTLKLGSEGSIRWGGASRRGAADSLWTFGGFQFGAGSDTTPRKVKALLDRSGKLLRLEIGPFDSLAVSGGMIRGQAHCPFLLVGTPETLGLQAAPPTEEPDPASGIRPGGEPWLWMDSLQVRTVHQVVVSPTWRALFDTSHAPVIAHGPDFVTFALDPVEPERGLLEPLAEEDWRTSMRLPLQDQARFLVGDHSPA